MQIDVKTTVPLFAIIASLPFAIGGIIWLTSIDAKASKALEIIDERRPIIQKTYEAVIRIEERLKRLEQKSQN